MQREHIVDQILSEVRAELFHAQNLFPPFNSAHEGYAVILEEMDELWQEIKGQYGPERTSNMHKEAVQVAAMALRFLFDIK